MQDEVYQHFTLPVALLINSCSRSTVADFCEKGIAADSQVYVQFCEAELGLMNIPLSGMLIEFTNKGIRSVPLLWLALYKSVWPPLVQGFVDQPVFNTLKQSQNRSKLSCHACWWSRLLPDHTRAANILHVFCKSSLVNCLEYSCIKKRTIPHSLSKPELCPQKGILSMIKVNIAAHFDSWDDLNTHLPCNAEREGKSALIVTRIVEFSLGHQWTIVSWDITLQHMSAQASCTLRTGQIACSNLTF